jgi:cyclophilin family peptidyl-prolyl cis-trans isomerase
MIPVPGMTTARRLATAGIAAWLFAGCTSIPAVTPSAGPSALPTAAPTAPAFSLAPTPSNCPTATPAPMSSGTATVTMTTNFGDIVIKVDSSLGTNATGAFLALARCGYYNNVIFHRIVPNFVIQSGDGTYGREPNIDWSHVGTGGPDWHIQDQAANTAYVRGTVAMARTSDANSANSQFFIVLSDTAFPAGTTDYAIVGNVTSGMDAVDRIAAIPTGGDPNKTTGEASMPLQPAVIEGTAVTTP